MAADQVRRAHQARHPLASAPCALRPHLGVDPRWAWAREEVTANTCLGTKAAVQERMHQFFAGLAGRSAEVQSRCRRKLQALAEAVAIPASESHQKALYGDPVGAPV